MKIFNYDATTGKLLGSSEADACPVTQEMIAERARRVFEHSENVRFQRTMPDAPLPYPDAKDFTEIPDGLQTEYHIPANATTIAPPEQVVDGMWPCFDVTEQKWFATPIATANGESEPALDPNSPEGKRAPREAMFKRLADDLLDVAARSVGFGNIADAVSYAEEDASTRLQMLGKSLRAFRSRVREAVTTKLAEFLHHEEIPVTAEEVHAVLPQWTMPEAEPAPGAQTVKTAPQVALDHVDAEHPEHEPQPEPAVPQPAPALVVKAASTS